MAARKRKEISESASDDRDDDQDTRNADARLAQKMRQRVKSGREGGDENDDPEHQDRSDDDGPTEIELRDPEDDDDDRGQQTSNRRQQKAERYRRMHSDLEETRRENDELRQQVQQNTQMMQQMMLRQQQLMQNPQGGQPPADPLQDKLNAIRERKRALQTEVNGIDHKTVTPEMIRQYEERAYKLQDEEREVEFDMIARRRGMRPHNPHEAVAQQFAMKHPEVMGNASYRQIVQGNYQKLRLQGRPDSADTVEEAIDMVKRDFKLGKYAGGGNGGHQRVDRSKYVGMPRGVPGSGSGDGGSVKKVVMTKEFKKMAESANPGLKPEKAWERWANGPGRRLLEKRQSRT